MAAQRNDELRAAWTYDYGDIPAEYFISIDESAIDGKNTSRTQGWADVGRSCVRRDVLIRGVRYSLLPAITTDGVLALDIFEGSVTKERFIHFLRNTLVRTNPFEIA